MRTDWKRCAALILASMMLFGLTACGRGDREDENQIPESTGGKDLARAESVDNVFSLNTNTNYSLNPYVATNHSNQLVCDLVYENMVEVDENFRAIPNVIGSWTMNDDATIWTLTLDTSREHNFSDGDPVTGRDLVYSIGYAIYNDRFRGRFASFKGASYTDDGMTVTLGIGDSQFIKLLNIPVIKQGTFEVEAHVPPIGSGPYMYDEERITLLANPYYPDSKNLPLQTIYLQEYTDAEGTLEAFEDGIIDVAVNDPSSYTSLGYASSNEIHSFATTNYHFIMFNEESTFGKSSAFRIAMQYAFDRDYLIELLGGDAVPSAVPLYPTVDYYPHALADSLQYNLKTCAAVLQSAGIADTDGDGRMEYSGSASGRFEIVIIVCADSSAKAGIVNRFKDDMKSIGINVNVQELGWDEYLQALKDGYFESGNLEVTWDMYYGEVKLRNNFDLTELMQVRTKDNENLNINYSRTRDTSIVDRINNYLRATDAARPVVYNELCDYLTRTSGNLVSIGFEKQQLITHRGVVKGLNPNFGNPLYDFQNWTIILDE
ncbi:MAG: ABC transporter substrate-binding protein [Oscillospiraceae bacterium]|nr:ABC transporter substrate-binding protein [Oscillospiraceae bacterium]